MLQFYKEAFGFELVGEEFKPDRVETIATAMMPRMVTMRAGNCFLQIIQFDGSDPNFKRSLHAGAYAHFSEGSPHDAMFPMQRFVRRMADEGA